MGFFSIYDGELREPLVWPQGSPVSIRVASASAALLSSHERGISRSFLSCGRKPWVSSTCDGDLRELLIVPIGSQEYCGLGKGLSDSIGLGAIEECLISS